MLQNGLESDVARFTTHVQTCQQPDLVQDRFACMHVFCCLFLSTLRAPSIQTKTPALNFRQLPVANGTALFKIFQTEDNLAWHTQILETFVPLFPSFRKCWLNAGKRSKDYISPRFMP